MNNSLDSVQQLHSVVESPDGEIQYCKPISINKNNPYRNVPLDNLSQNNTQVECDGNTIYIPTNVLDSAIKLQYKAQLVRLLCLIDFTMNLIVSLSTYYGAFFSMIISVISITGYYSTFTYSRSGLISYLVYQYLQTITKIITLIFYILLANGINPTIIEKNNIILSYSIDNTIILSLYVITQIYINYFVQQFYNLLPKIPLTSQESIYIII
jgi:hypothetical protein